MFFCFKQVLASDVQSIFISLSEPVAVPRALLSITSTPIIFILQRIT
jgi:hypothetical protein